MVKFRWEMEFRETEIGEMPKDWETKELGKVIKINKKPRNTNKKPIAFISMENIPEDGLYPKFEVKNPNEVKSGIEVFSGSLLLAKITPSFEHGKSCIVPKESNYKWVATTEVFSILPKDDMVDLLYLFYFFKFPVIREGLQYTMTGTSGRQRVPKDALEQLEIPYPPPEEQTRIATVLSWFDDLIENKRKQNEILEKMAMAIFKSWFIDFEPFQDEEFVYNEELDMEIPKGWHVVKIKEIGEVYGGTTPSTKNEEYWEGDVPWITPKDLANNKDKIYIFRGERNITEKAVKENSMKIFPPGTILLTSRAPIGYVAIAGDYMTTNQGFKNIIPKKDRVSSEYLFCLIKYIRPKLEAIAGGSTFPEINKTTLENIHILLPPKEILDTFTSIVKPLFQKFLINQNEIDILKGIRDLLLPQLVFGRLRVEAV